MYVLGYSGFTRDSRDAPGYRNPFAKTRQGFDNIFDFRDGEVPFQMFPLGFFGHDAAAALIKDGRLIACAAEERFNRSKYSLNLAGNTLLPKNAIEFCLQTANISIKEIDVVAHYCDFTHDLIQKRLALLKPFISAENVNQVKVAYENTYNQMMNRKILLSQFTKMTGEFPEKFVQVNHHQAHAASAFYPSGFKHAIILTIDGTGEVESSMLGIGEHGEIHEIRRTMIPHSLGALYLIITVFLGFKSLGDEYKVMGMAGYGTPENYLDFFESLIHLENDGEYSIHHMLKPDFKQILMADLGPARKPDEPITKRHYDIAAALQKSLENTVLHTLQYAREQYQISKLCMAGGVALNSMMNGAIAGSGLFDEIFIQPASSDEGCSLGAAYHAYVNSDGRMHDHNFKMRNVYLGPAYQNKDIRRSLKMFRDDVNWEYTTDLSARTAREIADGKVIGWFQGRMEFGPRALGNRSILADPRTAGMKDRINAKIKHREDFRPFAPAVCEEDAASYFQLNGLKSSPYMLFVVPVRKNYINRIPAVTHVDGTARIQTVSKRTNNKFWQLLSEFKKLTGLAIILNTSFNIMNEPIVCNPDDAIRCFLNTDLDLLVIGNFLVRKINENCDS